MASSDSTLNAPEFPAGLRVLVVDDDNVCLKITKKMLQRCHYRVTTSTHAKEALNLLRERKGCFDVILSDVYMPDMDGYKLLEHVGLEMDLPVIMMSADGSTSAVMKGIKHGACDYLIKPIRQEALKNIWQHVVRKKLHENKEVDHSESLDENDRNKRGNDDGDYSSSINEGSEEALRSQRKRSHAKEEEEGEPDSDDTTASKKPRVVWSVELHDQFVNAVNQLGIDKAVPKRILELMNVPGLTRENVASHLQKFRLYLKKMSVVGQQSGTSSAYSGPLDSNLNFHTLGRFDIQALAASGQIPPHTLAAMNAELLGQPTASSHVAAVDPPAVFHACQSNVSKHFPQNLVPMDDVSSVYGAWPNAKFGATNTQNGNILVDMLPELNHSVNVQPFQNGNVIGNAMVNYGNVPEGHIKPSGVLSGFSDSGFSRQVQNSTATFSFTPNLCDVQGIYGLKPAENVDQGQFGNLGFVGKRASIPIRSAVDEYEATIHNFSHESNGMKAKQDSNNPVSQKFPPMMF